MKYRSTEIIDVLDAFLPPRIGLEVTGHIRVEYNQLLRFAVLGEHDFFAFV